MSLHRAPVPVSHAGVVVGGEPYSGRAWGSGCPEPKEPRPGPKTWGRQQGRLWPQKLLKRCPTILMPPKAFCRKQAVNCDPCVHPPLLVLGRSLHFGRDMRYTHWCLLSSHLLWYQLRGLLWTWAWKPALCWPLFPYSSLCLRQNQT